jgi:3-methyladenine DNA glycosylase AlkD
VLALLRSRVHEERLLALIILVRRFARGGAADRARIHGLYLAHARWINNWDLVDLSAPQIVGDWLTNRDRSLLDRLATSPSLWERRIAIVATLALIRAGDYADTLRVADALLSDREDLIHKATGWMLREVAKRDRATVEAFLIPRCRTMPRTMLRYAIERFPEPLRQAYLSGAVAGAGRIERRARSVS